MLETSQTVAACGETKGREAKTAGGGLAARPRLRREVHGCYTLHDVILTA